VAGEGTGAGTATTALLLLLLLSLLFAAAAAAVITAAACSAAESTAGNVSASTDPCSAANTSFRDGVVGIVSTCLGTVITG
jgi:hypothetical protein